MSKFSVSVSVKRTSCKNVHVNQTNALLKLSRNKKRRRDKNRMRNKKHKRLKEFKRYLNVRVNNALINNFAS